MPFGGLIPFRQVPENRAIARSMPTYSDLPPAVRWPFSVACALVTAFSNQFPPGWQSFGFYTGLTLLIFSVVASLWHGMNVWRGKRGLDPIRLRLVHFLLLVLLATAFAAGWFANEKRKSALGANALPRSTHISSGVAIEARPSILKKFRSAREKDGLVNAIDQTEATLNNYKKQMTALYKKVLGPPIPREPAPPTQTPEQALRGAVGDLQNWQSLIESMQKDLSPNSSFFDSPFKEEMNYIIYDGAPKIDALDNSWMGSLWWRLTRDADLSQQKDKDFGNRLLEDWTDRDKPTVLSKMQIAQNWIGDCIKRAEILRAALN